MTASLTGSGARRPAPPRGVPSGFYPWEAQVLEVAAMMRRGSTVRGAVTGADRPMDQREAHAVQRCFRVSAVIGVIAAVASFFTVLVPVSGVQAKLYALFGVFGFTTLIAFTAFNAVISIDRHFTLRRELRETQTAQH